MEEGPSSSPGGGDVSLAVASLASAPTSASTLSVRLESNASVVGSTESTVKPLGAIRVNTLLVPPIGRTGTDPGSTTPAAGGNSNGSLTPTPRGSVSSPRTTAAMLNRRRWWNEFSVYGLIFVLVKWWVVTTGFTAAVLNIPLAESDAGPTGGAVYNTRYSFGEFFRAHPVFMFVIMPFFPAIAFCHSSETRLWLLARVPGGDAKDESVTISYWRRWWLRIQVVTICYAGMLVFEIIIAASAGYFPLLSLLVVLVYSGLVLAAVQKWRIPLPPHLAEEDKAHRRSQFVSFPLWGILGLLHLGYLSTSNSVYRSLLILGTGLTGFLMRAGLSFALNTPARTFHALRIIRPTIWATGIADVLNYLSLFGDTSYASMGVFLLITVSTSVVQPILMSSWGYRLKGSVERLIGFKSDTYAGHVEHSAATLFYSLYAHMISAAAFIVISVTIRYGPNAVFFPAIADPTVCSDATFWTAIAFAAIQFVVVVLFAVGMRSVLSGMCFELDHTSPEHCAAAHRLPSHPLSSQSAAKSAGAAASASIHPDPATADPSGGATNASNAANDSSPFRVSPASMCHAVDYCRYAYVTMRETDILLPHVILAVPYALFLAFHRHSRLF